MAEENRNQQTSVSNPYNPSALSALQMRLDTSEITRGIEENLRGYMFTAITDKESGMTKTKKVKIGKKRANDEGIQAIMCYVHSIINSQTVQGNFNQTQYEQYIQYVWKSLAFDLMLNRLRWNINIEDYNFVINFIMSNIIAFMSRTIDNEERISYSQTIKTLESIREQNKGGFNMFGNAQGGG